MGAFTIEKVLNSSVILVTDAQGQESILLGKGIGYGRKRGETVSDAGENQVFVPVDAMRTKQVQELAQALAPEIWETTQEIVTQAERMLGTSLSSGIYLVLADHINFAIERVREGLRITNRVFWEIKNYYPDEFRAGLVGVQLVQERLGIELPEEEAANIAFHIANARAGDEEPYDAVRYAKVIGKIINLTLLSLNHPVDTQSIHYLRFVTHIKYFVERYFTSKMLDNDDDLLYLQLTTRYQRELDIAGKIQTYLEENYKIPVTQNELVYLAVHIVRLDSV